MVSTINEYKQKRIEQIEKLIETAGLMSHDITEAVREYAKNQPNLKDYAEKMATWRDTINDSNDLDMVDEIWEGLANLIENLMKKKNMIKNHKKFKMIKNDGRIIIKNSKQEMNDEKNIRRVNLIDKKTRRKGMKKIKRNLTSR